jgi:hypothetical protein
MAMVADSTLISDNFFQYNGTTAKANGASEATVSTDNTPTKPKRPLTSYHIYFQLEREYIVQTMEGEDADKSMHDNKVYLDYVPDRYKQIKLSLPSGTLLLANARGASTARSTARLVSSSFRA